MAKGGPKPTTSDCENPCRSRHKRERHRHNKRHNAVTTTSVPTVVPLPQSQGSVLPGWYPAPQPQPPPPSSPPERIPAPLEALPGDVWDKISSYTPYETLLAVQRSSPIFWKKVNPKLAPDETKVSFVLRAESEFPQHQQWSNGSRRSGRGGGRSGRNTEGGGGEDDDDDDNNAQGQVEERTNNYGCFKCFRVLPPTQFEALRLPPRAPVRVPIDMRRFCIPCGVDAGIYQPREQVVPMKGPKVWVCGCGAIQEESTYHCRICQTHCPFRQ